jgi:hypothetical protein
MKCFKAGTTISINGGATNCEGKASDQNCLPSDIVTLLVDLPGTAPKNIVDEIWVNARALDKAFQNISTEIIRPDEPKNALFRMGPSHGGSHCINNPSFSHK